MRCARALLLLFLACKQSDPVAATINDIAKAAEERDAAAVISHLAPDYSDQYGGPAETERVLKQYFFAYKTINVSIHDLEIRRHGASAEASFRVNFRGDPKQIGGLDQLLPPSAVYHFDISLAEQNGAWKVVTAQWREESKPPL